MASLDFEASSLKACKKAAFAIVEAGMWGSEHDTCHEGTKAFKNGAKSRPTLDTTEKEKYICSNSLRNILPQCADEKSNESVEDMDWTLAGW